MTGWPGWKSLCIHQSVQYNMTGWPGWKSLCIHQSVQYNMTGWLGWRLMGWWQWQSGLKLSMEPLSSLKGMRAWLSDFDVKCIRFSFRLWYQSINVAIWYFRLKKVLGFFFFFLLLSSFVYESQRVRQITQWLASSVFSVLYESQRVRERQITVTG